MIRKALRLVAIVLLLPVLAGAAPAPAPPQPAAELAVSNARRPLLIEGKKTLYQRVVVHPGAELREAPDAAAKGKGAVKTFSVLYVYDLRKDAAGAPAWYEVGPGIDGRTDGWLPAAQASPWRQSMTLRFTERTGGRDPVLFFGEQALLEKLVTSPGAGDEARRLGSAFEKAKGAAGADLPVVAREPEQAAVAGDRFYLLPIFAAKSVTPPVGPPVTLLQVASIDPGAVPKPAAPGPVVPQDPRALRTGIAFVLDTTQSMDPYLEKARQAIRRLYDRLSQAGQLKNVSFAAVGFRNSTVKTPKLEYVAKVFADFDDKRPPEKLLSLMQGMTSTTVSSHSFSEDAFAGLRAGIRDLDWRGYGARVIFFVTDAGAIRKEDPAGSTGMNETEVGLLAKENGIRILAFHLLTPAGKRARNHEGAERQYRQMTQSSDETISDLYFPIPDGNAEIFGTAVERSAEQLAQLVSATAEGRRLPPPPPPKPDEDAAAAAARKAAAIGYAMQLEFLGRRDAQTAPQLVRSWVADRDLARPGSQSLEVDVLLTRQQLSDLHSGVAALLAEVQRAKRIGSADFFDELRSAAARVSRDPQMQNRQDMKNLEKLGAMAEFLEDLPYKSRVLTMTRDEWATLSIGEQQDFVNDLESKLALYVNYDEQSDGWEGFGARNPNDFVFRVPLDALP